jgi:hypothetical protein
MSPAKTDDVVSRPYATVGPYWNETATARPFVVTLARAHAENVDMSPESTDSVPTNGSRTPAPPAS